MTIELTDNEAAMIVDAMRQVERRSREGFSKWFAENMDSNESQATEKMMKMRQIFADMSSIRKKLGDPDVIPLRFGSK